MQALLKRRKRLETELQQYAGRYRGSEAGFREWLPEASSIIQQMLAIDRGLERERQLLVRILELAIDEFVSLANMNESERASQLARIISQVPVKMYDQKGLDLGELKGALESYQSAYIGSKFPSKDYATEIDTILRFESEFVVTYLDSGKQTDSHFQDG